MFINTELDRVQGRRAPSVSSETSERKRKRDRDEISDGALMAPKSLEQPEAARVIDMQSDMFDNFARFVAQKMMQVRAEQALAEEQKKFQLVVSERDTVLQRTQEFVQEQTLRTRHEVEAVQQEAGRREQALLEGV